jgi:hypothetical protein
VIEKFIAIFLVSLKKIQSRSHSQGRMCVAGHQIFGCKELEECGIKWGRMVGNSEEGQGPQRAVAPMMMMMKPFSAFFVHP